MIELRAVHAFDVYEAYLKTGDDDAAQVYRKSEADTAIENIVKGAVSMFRESSYCIGLDMKSALGRIANAAFKHWNRVKYIESNVRQLRLDKAQLLSSNEVLHLHLKSQTSARLTDKIEYAISIRHQKYKRCLAMAKLCAKNVDHLNSEGYIYEKEGRADEVDDCIKGTQFYHKWYERWLEIAEQFKAEKDNAEILFILQEFKQEGKQ